MATMPGETERGPDERIKEDVCECLTRHNEIDASDVEVRVANGEVTLQGSVPTRREKQLIEGLIDECAGVRDVHNRLNVRDGELGTHLV